MDENIFIEIMLINKTTVLPNYRWHKVYIITDYQSDKSFDYNNFQSIYHKEKNYRIYNIHVVESNFIIILLWILIITIEKRHLKKNIGVMSVILSFCKLFTLGGIKLNWKRLSWSNYSAMMS